MLTGIEWRLTRTQIAKSERTKYLGELEVRKGIELGLDLPSGHSPQGDQKPTSSS